MKVIPNSKVACVWQERALLGESPVWHPEEQKLYWVDIEGRSFNCFDPYTGQNTRTETPERFGCFAFREQGGVIAATENGFHFFDPATQTLTPITDPEKDKPNNRFNDGRCDRAGRFWAGTMIERGPQQPDASLWCLSIDQKCMGKLNQVILANGLAWSPDNKTAYFADTRVPVVWAFDYEIDGATLSNQQVFIEFGDKDGVPDGAAIDSAGCYWLAQARAGKIGRYTPAGQLDTVIELPVTKPTMCAFGGRDLKTLYITTNSNGFSDAEMVEQPLAGSLFAVDLDVSGLPEPKYAG